MGLLIRLSTKEREYVTKAQRPEYWENRIEKLNAELTEIPETEQENIVAKKKEIEAVKKAQAEALSDLKTFDGPTKFTILSIPKAEIRAAMPKDLQKRFINITENDGISVGTLEYSRDYSSLVCRLGIKNWSNLHNLNDDGTTTVVEFDKNLIDRLPDDVLTELSNEISGVIDRDTIKK